MKSLAIPEVISAFIVAANPIIAGAAAPDRRPGDDGYASSHSLLPVTASRAGIETRAVEENRVAADLKLEVAGAYVSVRCSCSG